jgi:hypothetical protein
MPLYVDITRSTMLHRMICLEWIMSGVTRAELPSSNLVFALH